MGTYQGRTAAATQKSEGAGQVIVSSPSDQAPPVFGSPIDKSYLASIATKVGVGVNLISEVPSSVEEAVVIESSQIQQKEDSAAPADGDQSQTSPEATVTSQEEQQQQVSKEQEQQQEKQEKLIPIVFHWDHGGNGNEVYVCGSFNNWQKIPMNKSRGNFTTIVELPEGRHQYKFYVNGEWVHDPGEECQDNGLGTLNNVVTVTQKDFDVFNNQMIDFSSFKKNKGSESPPGSYSQVIPPRSAASGLPPHLPSLLQQTVLNQDLPSEENPTILPDPNHVTLNHLFALSIKDGVLVMGTTNRYKEKYITTLMYKPVQ